MNAILNSAATAFAALLGVLGLIWLGARVLRAARPGLPGDGGRLLAVRGVLALDSRRRIYLIACGERHLLLLIGGGNDAVLGWLPTEPVA